MTTILGHSLPPARAEHVWAMQIFAGGRRVVVQAMPYKLSTQAAALEKLKAGHRVYVSLDDAISVLREAKLPGIRER